MIGGAGTEWLRDRRSSSRATIERQEARQERRDELERQTLIELQDSLHAYVRGIAKACLFDEQTQKEHGQYFQTPEDISNEIHAAQVLTAKLATRVSDDEIRRWIDEVIEEGSAAVLPPIEEPRRHWVEMGRISNKAQEKIGLRIRNL